MSSVSFDYVGDHSEQDLVALRKKIRRLRSKLVAKDESNRVTEKLCDYYRNSKRIINDDFVVTQELNGVLRQLLAKKMDADLSNIPTLDMAQIEKATALNEQETNCLAWEIRLTELMVEEEDILPPMGDEKINVKEEMIVDKVDMMITEEVKVNVQVLEEKIADILKPKFTVFVYCKGCGKQFTGSRTKLIKFSDEYTSHCTNCKLYKRDNVIRVCRICQKKFFYLFQFKNHMRTHRKQTKSALNAIEIDLGGNVDNNGFFLVGRKVQSHDEPIRQDTYVDDSAQLFHGLQLLN